MKPGYQPTLLGRPEIVLTTSTNVTSTSYLYGDPISVGAYVQLFMGLKVTLGAGVTSFEAKLQQCLSADPTDDWFNVTLLDTANKTTVANEYVSIAKPDVASIDVNTGTDGKLLFLYMAAMPFVRVAYKISGAGTANAGILVGRVGL